MNATYSGLVPLLVVRGASQAINFYVQALGAELGMRVIRTDP